MSSPAEVIERERARIRPVSEAAPLSAPALRGRAEDQPMPSDVAQRWTPAEPEWFSVAPPKREWLLRDSRTAKSDGVLPRGKVGLLLAEGGIGKTMVLIQLAIAHAVGAPWLGAFIAPTQGRTLLLLGEEDVEEGRRRAFNACRSMGCKAPEPGTIVLLPLAGVPCAMIEADECGNTQESGFLVALRSLVVERGPFGLVIVDPLSRFAGADAEVDNAAATRFVQALESISSETGATVIVAHHVNKSARGTGATVTGASARGSSAIFDGVRWAAALSAERIDCEDADTAARLGELVTLTVVKSNYSRKGEPVVLRRDQENGGALLPLDETDAEMVVEARAGANPSARRRARRDDEGRARVDALGSAVLEALRGEPGGLTYRKLRGAVQARTGSCSDPALTAALSVLGENIRTESGPNRSVLHFLSEVRP